MNEFAPLASFGLLLVRPSVLIGTAQVFGAAYAPLQLRIGLAVIVAVIMAPFVPVPASLNAAQLLVVAVREVAVGLALGLSVHTLIAGAEMAGRLAGFQLGFSYASIIDPQSGVRNNMLSLLYGNLAVVTFFATNGHHALLRALTDSYVQLPMGGGRVSPSLVTAVMGMLGTVFLLGVRLALPLIMVLLIIELTMGLVSRISPHLNPMVIGMPLRILVGLLVIAAVLPLTPSVLVRFTGSVFELGLQAARAFE